MVSFNEITLREVLSRVHGCKKEGSGYKALCPAHDDHNPSLGIIEKNGKVLLQCFSQNCSYKDIITALGLNYSNQNSYSNKITKNPPQLPSNSSKRKYKNLDEYAAFKGVTSEVFIKAGWEDFNYYGHPAIKFSTINGNRYRLLDIEKGCFRSDKGFKNCWYKLEEALQIEDSPLILCNGEPSTVVAQHFDLAAFCFSGGENTDLPDHAIEELKEVYDENYNILVALDNDKTGKVAALKKLAQLKNAGFTNVKALDFGSDKPNGYDLADFVKEHKENSLEQLLKLPDLVTEESKEITEDQEIEEIEEESSTYTNNKVRNSKGYYLEVDQWVKASDRENYGKVIEVYPATKEAKIYFKNPQTGKEAYKIFSVNELTPINESSVPTQFLSKVKPFKLISAKNLLEQPDPQWLVENIFLEKSVVFLYGQPGVGKSFIALDLSLSITSGQKWSNKEVKTGSVVYVAAEGSAGIGKRIKAWLEHHKTSIPDNFYFITVPANLMHETVTDSLIASIKEVCPNPKMIVLDTFARSLVGGDENSAKDTGLFIAGVDRLKEETEATILILHHTQKANGNVERGSSAIRGSADTMIIAQTENEHGRMSFSLKCDKQKDAEPFDLMQFHLLPVLDSCVPVSTAFEKKVEKTSDNVILALKILNNFVSTEGTTFSKWQEVAKNKGMSKSSFYRTFKTLIDEVKEGQPKYVRCSNKRYYLTDEGKAFLGIEQNKIKEVGSSTSSTSSKLVSGTNETSSSTSSTSSKHISKICLELVGTETETKKETKELKQNIDKDLLDSDPLIAHDANNEITPDKSRSYLLKDDAHKLLGQWLAFQRKLSPLDPTKIDKDIFGKAENLHREFLRKKSHADTDSVFLPAFEQTKAALENFCKTYVQREDF